MVKKLPYKTFKTIYSKVPRLCVEVVLQTQGGVILTKRSIPPEQGKWHIPGGTVLMNENIEQAVKRVAFEELGVKVTIEKLLGIIEYPSIKNYFSQPVGIAFLVSTKAKLISATAGADEARVFDSLPKSLLPDQKKFLMKTLKMKIEK